MDEIAVRLEELYIDLEKKSALDADATVSLIEALEEVFAGKTADEVITNTGLTESGLVLPGKSPMDLAGAVAALRGLTQSPAAMAGITALRDSLYRYQSFIK